MRSQPFSIATDGSNDSNQLKQFPLVVQTFNEATGCINAELFAMKVCEGPATGKNIFELIDEEFRALNIPLSNCIKDRIDET
jgi:hypothetical protein